MKISSVIDWRIFLVSFLLGILYICIVEDSKQVLFVYPNLENTHKNLKV